jgi:hypothetical protein
VARRRRRRCTPAWGGRRLSRRGGAALTSTLPPGTGCGDRRGGMIVPAAVREGVLADAQELG